MVLVRMMLAQWNTSVLYRSLIKLIFTVCFGSSLWSVAAVELFQWLAQLSQATSKTLELSATTDGGWFYYSLRKYSVSSQHCQEPELNWKCGILTCMLTISKAVPAVFHYNLSCTHDSTPLVLNQDFWVCPVQWVSRTEVLHTELWFQSSHVCWVL